MSLVFSKELIDKLMDQFFDHFILKKKVILFYNKYYHFIDKFDISLKKLLQILF